MNDDQTVCEQKATEQPEAVVDCSPSSCSPFLDLRLGDCMDLMRETPDNHFDLAIVDPPYGIGVNRMNMGSRKTVQPDLRKWDDEIPPPKYFAELRRVSKRQIVWGGNYFPLPPSRGWAVWDKGESMYGRSFAEVELAWMSEDVSARILKLNPVQPNRFHPTQKPVKLYNWLLENYAKPEQRILDTHMGSGSIAIACHYFGAYLTATEIDEDYFNAACERIENETRQMDLFQENDQGQRPADERLREAGEPLHELFTENASGLPPQTTASDD